MSYRLLVTGVKQIVQITDDPHVSFLSGKHDMNNIKILDDDSSQLSVLVDSHGIIKYIGNEAGALKLLGDIEPDEKLDALGGVLIPGFVDGHSHPVFAGDRVHEFAMKLAGATYMEVQAAGGGIHFTTTKTREATEDQLLDDFLNVATLMIHSGTTTLEAKSGYGLEMETELKMLRVLSRLSDFVPLEISATFCGAHAVPKGVTEAEQTDLICNEIIPAIEKEKKEGKLRNLENIDVFCEKGVFGVETTRRILEEGKKTGLNANFHAEELNWIGGVELGAELGARAMSHLEEISEKGIEMMASSGSVAVLLPSTAFILRLTPPPARKMIEKGVVVALGSDFNPNAFCFAMPMIMHLACITMKLSMPEALVAATLNSAHSIGRGKTHGAICVGRKADMVVLNANSWEHVVYRMAGHSSVIQQVIKNGHIVFQQC
ncbi:unnamed protein product [Auanema sp. JU1783]|nr:unnamed protein product [Auanema sp. JU1783]